MLSWLGSQYPQALAASGHRGHPLLPGAIGEALEVQGTCRPASCCSGRCPSMSWFQGHIVPPGVVSCPPHADLRSQGGPARRAG